VQTTGEASDTDPFGRRGDDSQSTDVVGSSGSALVSAGHRTYLRE
jgi:hypothetical protein